MATQRYLCCKPAVQNITWRSGLAHSQCHHLGTWLLAGGPLQGATTLRIPRAEEEEDINDEDGDGPSLQLQGSPESEVLRGALLPGCDGPVPPGRSIPAFPALLHAEWRPPPKPRAAPKAKALPLADAASARALERKTRCGR